MNDTSGVNGRKDPLAAAVEAETPKVESPELLAAHREARERKVAAALQSYACAESLRTLADRVESGEIPMQFGVVVYVAVTQDGTGDLHAKGVNDEGQATATIVGMLSMAANRIGELRP